MNPRPHPCTNMNHADWSPLLFQGPPREAPAHTQKRSVRCVAGAVRGSRRSVRCVGVCAVRAARSAGSAAVRAARSAGSAAVRGLPQCGVRAGRAGQCGSRRSRRSVRVAQVAQGRVRRGCRPPLSAIAELLCCPVRTTSFTQQNVCKPMSTMQLMLPTPSP